MSFTAVVTGATSGIGRELAGILAARGARVIGIGRDPGRCVQAQEELSRCAQGGEVLVEVADLSSLADIRALAARISRITDHVDVLVNNAGTFTFRRSETVDGIERQLAVNWLAGFALTGLLLPLLRSGPSARVVMVSSGSHFSGTMHWGDLGLHHGYQGLRAYDQSKLASVLYTYELARRLGTGSRICTYAVDPGLVRTEIGMKGGGPLVRAVWKLRARRGISPRAAAESVSWCAVEKAAASLTGLYWKECQPLSSSPRSYDREDAARLWREGEKLSGVRYP